MSKKHMLSPLTDTDAAAAGKICAIQVFMGVCKMKPEAWLSNVAGDRPARAGNSKSKQ